MAAIEHAKASQMREYHIRTIVQDIISTRLVARGLPKTIVQRKNVVALIREEAIAVYKAIHGGKKNEDLNELLRVSTPRALPKGGFAAISKRELLSAHLEVVDAAVDRLYNVLADASKKNQSSKIPAAAESITEVPGVAIGEHHQDCSIDIQKEKMKLYDPSGLTTDVLKIEEMFWEVAQTKLGAYSLAKAWQHLSSAAAVRGLVTIKELRHQFTQWSIPATEDEIQRLFDRYDVHKRGRIDFTDIQQALMERELSSTSK